PFRFSVGVLQNDSALSAVATPSQSYTIGDTTYDADDVGTLRGRIGFDGTAAFAGLGWDWLRQKKVGVSFDLGLLSQGAPNVRLSADGPIADDPDFQSSLAEEEAELQSSLDDLDLYPYASFGVAFRF
ncbi:MAG: hypothetical protein R3305_01375, partial [Gammaproteobacteria bacterium]|nr:hypothetical protein [Gammaproteobacteria bacterium]